MSGTAVERLVIPGAPNALELDELRVQLGAPDATPAELRHFSRVCLRLDLSPWADQIVFIGRNDSRANRKVYRHQITVAGRRTLATRTGELVGIEGPVWCGPRNDRGELVWLEVWDHEGDEHPYCARTLVHRRGWIVPANGTAKWSEFAQLDSRGNLIPTWAGMASHMLGKVSESLALRRAFPDVIDAAVAQPFPLDPDAPLELELAEAEAELDVAGSPPRSTGDRLEHRGGSDGPAGRLPATWEPSTTEQGEAHRVIGALGALERSTFLARWDIGDFSREWPRLAVADALELEVEA